MSIAVALIGSSCSVIASDSRCTHSDGSTEDTCEKLFHSVKYPITFAVTGLLKFSGYTTGQWFDLLLPPSLGTIDRVTHELSTAIAPKLSAIAESEVGFEHRRLDLVLVGREIFADARSRQTIRSISFFPKMEMRKISCEVKTFDDFCTSGDDTAKSAVTRKLKASGAHRRALPVSSIELLARQLVRHAIRNTGLHPVHKTPACGGPVQVLVG